MKQNGSNNNLVLDVETLIISAVMGRRLDRRTGQVDWQWFRPEHQRFQSECIFKSIFKVIWRRRNNLINFFSFITPSCIDPLTLKMLPGRIFDWLFISHLWIFLTFTQIKHKCTKNTFSLQTFQTQKYQKTFISKNWSKPKTILKLAHHVGLRNRRQFVFV